MALKSKEQELPEEIEPTTKQVSFDEIDFEAEYADLDAEAETKVYYTLSGKEQEYEPTWQRYTAGDLNVGDEFEGRPEVSIFPKDDKSYNAMKLRVMDDGEILDLYFNYPKKDYPHVKNLSNIRKSEKNTFDFYLTAFDVVFSVLKWRDERNVVNPEGEEINKFKSVNIENLMKFVDSMTRVGVRIIEGSPYNDYPSWMIYKMEE